MRFWRGLRYSVKTLWMLILAASLLGNIALGVVNFVFQPVWRAAAVASAVTAVKAKAEILERKAIAKVKANAEIQERKAVAMAKAKEQAEARAQRSAAIASAVATAKVQAIAVNRASTAKAVAREKAKGRIRRITVAVPLAGTAFAAGFEYFEYQEWKQENEEGDVQQYLDETLDVSMRVLSEVLDELPETIKPSQEKWLERYNWMINRVPFSAESLNVNEEVGQQPDDRS